MRGPIASLAASPYRAAVLIRASRSTTSFLSRLSVAVRGGPGGTRRAAARRVPPGCLVVLMP
ncbi:hypothetical protein Misp01_09400 [Microtetraspora sp. NBRC 13810]|nr:hypothetical protein Misp01_09400 [Microtetraspora sp. NBRC 13810]